MARSTAGIYRNCTFDYRSQPEENRRPGPKNLPKPALNVAVRINGIGKKHVSNVKAEGRDRDQGPGLGEPAAPKGNQ
jgi:hypothetical protein